MGTTATFSLPYPEETDEPDIPADMQALAEATDTALTDATDTQFVNPLYARKTGDEGRASTTTLANDGPTGGSLKLTGLVSGAIYQVSGLIIYDGGDSSTGNQGFLKWKFTVPDGSSGLYTPKRQNEAHDFAGAFPSNWTDTVTADTTGVGTLMSVEFTGQLIAGADGTLQLQWAQDHSNATNVHVKAGSFITARRVA